jgi:cyclase
MDVKKSHMGNYEVIIRCGSKKTGRGPVEYAKEVEQRGAGEILVNSIDQDGTMQGYDLQLIKMVSSAVKIPVIACGGAGKVPDFESAVKVGGASAVAAGSMFVFQGRHRAVLINMPNQMELERALGSEVSNL